MATKTIFVKSTLAQNKDGSWPLALHERHPEHPQPSGDAWVSGKKVVEVAQTPAVIAAIKEGKLEEVSASDAKSTAKASTATKTEATSMKETADKTESDLPEDLPSRELLIAQGITSFDALKQMSPKDVLALEGIGEARVKELDAYMAKNAKK